MNNNGNGRRHKLVAIDGNSLLYRAFFAMKHLSTSAGQPTNAVYGFTMMLLRLLQEERPDSIVVAFDAPVKTFRHNEFKDYKAQRKPAPDDLRAQAPIAREIVDAFRIPLIEIPGYEADDVVGTIAKQACERDYDTLIVTGDLDALQLVNDCVKVMTTVKGVTDTVVYDEQAVIGRFGIGPEQMVDFKALKGDPSDNIPGVPGVGDKTAAQLVKQFGSVEELLDRVDEVRPERLHDTIVASSGQALLSKRLAAIVTDVPVGVTVEDLRTREPDYDRLRTLFRALEFRTLLRRLPEPEASAGEPVGKTQVTELGEWRTIEAQEEFQNLISHLRKVGRFAVRIHSSDGKPTESDILGIAFSTGPDETAYVRIAGGQDPPYETATLDLGVEEKVLAVELAALRELLESQDIPKFGHDVKFEYEALKLSGVKLCGINFDIMVGAYVLNSARSSYAISDVAFEQIGLELPQIDRKAKNKEEQPSPEMVTCAEAEAVWRLVPVLTEKLERDGLLDLVKDVEMPLVPVLAEMEMRGVSVDMDYLRNLSVHLNEKIRALEQEVYGLAGHEFNIGSPKQLQTVLFEERQLPVGKRTKTGYSTDADTLELLALSYPVVAKILEWRELSKLKSTYADALPKLINPKTGRIHTSLNQAVTTTGRLSSSEPNLQNIPVRTEIGREIRKAFVVSGDNLLVSADYSQIELRILAHVTEDRELVRAFEHDEDVHIHTASTLFGVPEDQVDFNMRRIAKTVNFAVIYGMSDFGLAKELGISNGEARKFIDRYFAKFPGVMRYTEETLALAREKGYVMTLLGRRRYIPEIHSGNRNYRLFAERAAVNMPIQGTAADIMKLAMIAIDGALERQGMATQMVLQVHDELVFEVPPDELDRAVVIVKDLMETVYPLNVRLAAEVKVGKNWAEMRSVT
ncbi:MAG: DNA polymerase I [Armatimonadetes bacterium]|nr:DNA polymerase I [Armatimonadota bacterium]